jgi:5-methylcytosine-specific restriction enzyme subunit McrC
MTALPVQSPQEPVQWTEYGIPIRNLWHMLLYAWNEWPLKIQGAMQNVERAPTLDALLASILVTLMQQRLRIGLGRSYVNEEGTLRGIRGRINFAESLKHHTFERDQAYCEFQQYSANSLQNQIIRTTLTRLLQIGQFGPDAGMANELRHRLRWLTRNLRDIDVVELTPELISRQDRASPRYDSDYRLMLAICELILQRQMPVDMEGELIAPIIDRDAIVLHNIYERFVANFYRIHLKGWDVTPQKRLEWHAKESNTHLPFMIPDLSLQERSSGRLLIVDTKFTAHGLVQNQWGKPVFDSSHLYQLYAYLRSQEHISEAHRGAAGVLLYPAIHDSFSERIELQDHIMRIEFIDLTAAWQEIEQQLLDLILNIPES